MKKLYCIGILMCLCHSLLAQDSFTDAYQRYRPYFYHTPSEWNRIRREVATHGQEMWPLVKDTLLTLELTGYWEGKIPAPTSENTYLFKDEKEIGEIYSLICTPDAYGYIMYPSHIERDFKLSETPLFKERILTRGVMNTLATDVLYEDEVQLDTFVFSTDTMEVEGSLYPLFYNDNDIIMEYLKKAPPYDIYNVKNFYCYFDNRPKEVREKFSYTTRVTRAYNEEVRILAKHQKSADKAYALIPYWMTDLYLRVDSLSASSFNRYGYLGYIINPLNGRPELTNDWNVFNVLNVNPYNGKKYDLVAYCGDAVSTNVFLSNPEACRRFIYTVFNYPSGMINREQKLRFPSDTVNNTKIAPPSGLNLYLPEFDFTEKRALTQLVKSLSLTIDSLKLQDSLLYMDKDLILTFSTKAAVEHSGFIAGLQCFVDTVFFADFDEYGCASKIAYNDGKIDTSSFVTRITNPFYLFRIPYKQLNNEETKNDLWELMKCDYASGQWGLFFCIDLVLFFLLAFFLFMYYSSATFNMYMSTHHTVVFLLIITLGIEFIVFFFFMIEALSPQVIYFDLETGSITYLALIGLPVFPVILYFIYLNLDKRRQLP